MGFVNSSLLAMGNAEPVQQRRIELWNVEIFYKHCLGVR